MSSRAVVAVEEPKPEGRGVVAIVEGTGRVSSKIEGATHDKRGRPLRWSSRSLRQQAHSCNVGQMPPCCCLRLALRLLRLLFGHAGASR